MADKTKTPETSTTEKKVDSKKSTVLIPPFQCTDGKVFGTIGEKEFSLDVVDGKVNVSDSDVITKLTSEGWKIA